MSYFHISASWGKIRHILKSGVYGVNTLKVKMLSHIRWAISRTTKPLITKLKPTYLRLVRATKPTKNNHYKLKSWLYSFENIFHAEGNHFLNIIYMAFLLRFGTDFLRQLHEGDGTENEGSSDRSRITRSIQSVRQRWEWLRTVRKTYSKFLITPLGWLCGCMQIREALCNCSSCGGVLWTSSIARYTSVGVPMQISSPRESWKVCCFVRSF